MSLLTDRELNQDETVAATHGLRCPKCGSDSSLDVSARIWVRLYADGSDPDDAEQHDHEWDDDSAIVCRNGKCDWSGKVKDAHVKPEKKTPAKRRKK